jgi:GT2 family glycosyltransferase/ADP-heptose:LPS heptosyltransferase
MKFSFVIPSICHGERAQETFRMLFQDCISTLVALNGSDHEIILVDDGSPQRMQSQIAQECIRRGVKLLINQENQGFPRTVNKGMRAATGDIVVLVNNDIKFTHNVVEPFKKAFAVNQKIGIVGSLLYYPNNTIQHGGIIALGPGQFTHRAWHKTYETSPEVQKDEYLIAVTGALFGIRREMIEEVGYLNEEYFLACDDTEYCIRAWEKDWRIFYSPQVQAIHAEGVTRGDNDRNKLLINRHWYIKERETFGKFQKDIQNKFLGQWNGLLEKVHFANREMIGGVTPKSIGSCEKKHYGKGLVLSDITQPIGAKASGKILAVRRTGALGDVILTTGIVAKLKQMNPGDDIWFITVVPEVFKNNPHITKVVRNIEAIQHPVDRLIDLDMAYEMEPKRHMIEAYSRVAFPDQEPSSRYLPEMYSTDHDAKSLSAKIPSVKIGHDKIAVVHCAVGWPSRTFQRSKWNEVTKKLTVMGYKSLVIGRGGDYRSDLYGGVVNLVDHLTIHEVRELMKRASVFVGMDSGMMHIAMTTNIPTVGIFTVANPDFRIVERQAKTIALIPKVHCRYCLHEQTPPVTFVKCKYGTNPCLDDFSSDAIVDAVNEVSR